MPVEINISLILTRLDSGYYTSVSSVLGDVDTMWENCERYNLKSSFAWKIGKKICNMLRDGISEVAGEGRGGRVKRRKKDDSDDYEDEDHWGDDGSDGDGGVKYSKKKPANGGRRRSQDSDSDEEVYYYDDDDDEEDDDEDEEDEEELRRPRRNAAKYQTPKRSERPTRRGSGPRAPVASPGSDSFGVGNSESEAEFNDTESEAPTPKTDKRRSTRTTTTTSNPVDNSSRRSTKRRKLTELDSEDESNDGRTNASARISRPRLARSTLDLTKVNAKRDVKSLGLKLLKKFIEYRVERDLKGIFDTDPTRLPSYKKSIKTPMWYGKIRTKFEANKYKNLKLVVRDLELVWTNAMTYNVEETKAHKLAFKLMCEIEGIADAVVREDGHAMREYFMEDL